jgi:hypothetical protein
MIACANKECGYKRAVEEPKVEAPAGEAVEAGATAE